MQRLIINCISIALLFSLIISCGKKNENIVRTLSGTIVDSVSKDPILNTSLLLYVSGRNSGINSKPIPETFSFTTDDSGNFKAEFNTAEGYSLAIHYPDEIFVADGGLVFIWEGTIGGKEFNKDIGTIQAYKQ